jgi:transposase-like protein
MVKFCELKIEGKKMAKGIKYTQEFKDSAIQLALNSEDSVRQIAKDLEIHEKTLYGWLVITEKNIT